MGPKKASMDVDERQDLLHKLEIKHERNSGDSHLLFKDEDIRRLKLRILMLRDENTSLRDRVTQNDHVNTALVEECDDAKTLLKSKMETIDSLEKQLQTQEREYTNLKAELRSMTNATQDSADLLAEKLALTRELAVLKPELEHLRLQVNQQQATLSEKLSLERQVNTLEVEFANEKKAVKRAMQKRESNDRVEDELRNMLREAEKKVTAEKTKRERLEDQLEQEKRTHQFALQEQDSTRELEADLRKKLQEAQKQLREEQTDKEQLEEELQAVTRASEKAQKKQANKGVEDELRTMLEEAQNSLKIQKKETEKARQEMRTAVSEVEARNEELETKLEKFRTKMRDVQEQLKQCQADLRKAQKARVSVPEERTTKTIGGPQGFRKRKAHDLSMDEFTQITIQTPSAEDANLGRRVFKKRPIEPTVFGEKSTFSITPFLNRSKTGEDETPEQNDDSVVNDSILGTKHSTKTLEIPMAPEPAEAEAGESEPEAQATAADDDDKPKTKRGRPKKALGEAPSAKKNAQPAAKKILKKASKLALKKAPEEAAPAAEGDSSSQEEQPEAKQPAPAAEKTSTVKFNFTLPQDENAPKASNRGASGAARPRATAPAAAAEQPKKKKRKVLGSTKTLFDEDDGEAPAPAPAPAGLTRKPSKVQLGGARGLSKAPIGIKRNAAFAGGTTFSPLKRDRRGVGASFLA
ncbi:hypothetical protein MGN70_008157 [Eutypa lata]|nr:hypothetical protein MGN70_008157 [Eutypa lata]